MRKIHYESQLKKFDVLKAELRELEERIAENVVMLLAGAV